MRCLELIRKLEELSPPMYAMEWDNSGLLVGGMEQEIHKVLLSVDVTDEVIDEAIAHGVDMIIAHHPLIFRKIKRVVAEDLTGRRILRMVQHSIACYCMHTNFDIMGMADEAADMLGLNGAEVLDVTYEDDLSKEGIGRYGYLKNNSTLLELGEHVKRVFKPGHVTLYGDLDAPMVKVAISTGSGSDMVPLAIAAGCDAIITGDIGYHCALDAIAEGLCIIDAGHFGLEKIFIPYMKTYLEREAEGIVAIPSTQKEIGYHL